jgi:hypothetical protein
MTSRRVLSLALFIAWFAYAITLAFFSSATVNEVAQELEVLAKEQQQRVEVLRDKGTLGSPASSVSQAVASELRTLRALEIAAAVLGLAAALMAFLALPLWRTAVVVSSAFYFWLWATTGTLAYVPVVEAYKLKWMMAEALSREYGFFLLDAVMPVVCGVAVIYVVFDYIAKRKSSSGRN